MHNKTRVCSLVSFLSSSYWWESPLFQVPVKAGIASFLSSSYWWESPAFLILHISNAIIIYYKITKMSNSIPILLYSFLQK